MINSEPFFFVCHWTLTCCNFRYSRLNKCLWHDQICVKYAFGLLCVVSSGRVIFLALGIDRERRGVRNFVRRAHWSCSVVHLQFMMRKLILMISLRGQTQLVSWAQAQRLLDSISEHLHYPSVFLHLVHFDCVSIYRKNRSRLKGTVHLKMKIQSSFILLYFFLCLFLRERCLEECE